ncbi:hypothetical protein CY35_20G020400 [Sphagnum magellanicum]|nr:hypothetical protein CY35_20G020400 [Sphagnum magellanicum]
MEALVYTFLLVGTLGIFFFVFFFREPPKIPSKGKKKFLFHFVFSGSSFPIPPFNRKLMTLPSFIGKVIDEFSLRVLRKDP